MTDFANRRDDLDDEEGIEIDGFTLYPITMKHYTAFLAAKNALLIRQGSLPAEYAVMRYLQALFAMDYDAVKKEQRPLGFLGSLMAFLALALRYPVDAMVRSMKIKTAENDARRLVSIEVRVGEVLLHLTPATFDRMRPVLAEQNGLSLPDEAENIDLVEAEADIAASGASGVVFDPRTEIASVARDQRKRVSELMEYTIREYTELKAAIERDKLFTIYRTAELSGMVKFGKGNPVPSWCYDRKDAHSSMIAMADFMAGPGSVAAQH